MRLQWLRPAGGVVGLEVAAGERGALVVEHAADERRGFVQHVEPRADVWKRIAVGGCFPDVPTSAQAKLEPAAGEVIQRRRRLRQQRRIAVADVEHQAADAGAFRFRGQGAEGRQRFEVRLPAALIGRLVEVVPNGDPVHASRVEATPQRAHLVHRQVLLANVDAKGKGHGLPPSRSCAPATIAQRRRLFRRRGGPLQRWRR